MYLIQYYRDGQIYIIVIWEKLKNKVIQREEFNVKESQHYNISVLRNHHQDLERMIITLFLNFSVYYQIHFHYLLSLE